MSGCPSRIGYRPGCAVDNNVISFLERHRLRTPERIALRWLGPSGASGAWTFAELAERVESTAAGLARLGLKQGDRAFLFVPMSPWLYVAMFAVQRLGAIAVFLDSWARRDQLDYCAGLVAPAAFIGPEAAFALTAGVPALASVDLRIVVGTHEQAYDASLEALSAADEGCPITPVEQEETALITFTTGSSGAPKGADRTHRFLAAQHEALDRCLPYTDADLDLPVFPIFSLNNLAGGVSTMLPAVDLARPAANDGAALLTQIADHGVTCATLSPYLLRAVAVAGAEVRRTLPGLRRVATGGAPVSRDDVAAFRRVAPNAELHILYGSTEVEPIAHLVAADMPDGEGVCVGALDRGLTRRLLRLSREPIELGDDGWAAWEVGPGEIGELVVAGEHVCRNYYRDEGAFRRAKIVDAEGSVWHRTGDCARFDDQGRLWMVGRVHNAIRRGNAVLFPVQAEIALKALPFVAAAAYLGLPDETLGERAVAVYEAGGAVPPDADARVLAALAGQGVVVDEVRRVNRVPLDPRHHSKVEYERLRRELLGDA